MMYQVILKGKINDTNKELEIESSSIILLRKKVTYLLRNEGCSNALIYDGEGNKVSVVRI